MYIILITDDTPHNEHGTIVMTPYSNQSTPAG